MDKITDQLGCSMIDTAGSGDMGTRDLVNILGQTALAMSRTLARCWLVVMPQVHVTPPGHPARWIRRRTSDW